MHHPLTVSSPGALNVIRRGVYICMNGRVFDVSRCRRDAHSGIFYTAPVAKPGDVHAGKVHVTKTPKSGASSHVSRALSIPEGSGPAVRATNMGRKEHTRLTPKN